MPYKDPVARKEYQKKYRQLQKDKNRQYAKKPRNQQRLKDLKTKTVLDKGVLNGQESSQREVQGNDC